MLRNLFGRRSRRLLAITAVVFAAAGGIAYATIPDGGGVYTACMLKNVGTIRLIDPSLPPTNLLGHCTSLETLVSWNKQGQPGPAGPQGPQGDPGPQGPAGPAGQAASLTSLAGTPCDNATYLAGNDGTPFDPQSSPLSHTGPGFVHVAAGASSDETGNPIQLTCAGRAVTIAFHNVNGIEIRGRVDDAVRGAILSFDGFGNFCRSSADCVAHVGDGTTLTLFQATTGSRANWGPVCQGSPTPDDPCVVTVNRDLTVDVG